VTGSRALVVGDVIDDIIVVPVGPVRPDTDTTARISRHEGGSAANTAAWMAHQGAPVDFVGCVGPGDRERHDTVLHDLGVRPQLSEHPSLTTGTIVIVVEGEQRTMLTDRGANAGLGVDAVTDELLAGAGVLHLTGYSLVDAFSAAELGALIERAHGHGVLVTLDPGSAGFIADYGVAAFRAALRGVDVLLPNLAEGRLLAGCTDDDACADAAVAEALLELAPAVVLTHGAGAVVVARRGEPTTSIDVEAIEAVDPTGAGDAFTAGLLTAILAGSDLVEAARAGVRVASLAVTRPGARPPRR
jgi:sugar/nucleoside kinase (ribokinase family)